MLLAMNADTNDKKNHRPWWYRVAVAAGLLLLLGLGFLFWTFTFGFKADGLARNGDGKTARDLDDNLGPLTGTIVGESYGTAAVDVQNPYCGVEGKLLHWFTCDEVKGKTCEKHFRTKEQATAAGYRLHVKCMMEEEE